MSDRLDSGGALRVGQRAVFRNKLLTPEQGIECEVLQVIPGAFYPYRIRYTGQVVASSAELTPLPDPAPTGEEGAS